MYSKVLVALDDSEASKRAAEKDEFVSHVLSNCAEEAQQIFRPLEKKIEELGIRCIFKTPSGDPAEEIPALAEEEKVDLIIVGQKRSKGLKRFSSSLAEKIAEKTDCRMVVCF